MLDTVREFKYTKLSPEEQKERGILGRLAGTIADFKRPTRNERLYTEELWDKTFDDPLMQEKLENKLLLGELGHPENRTEIDMEKVAICLAEKPVKCPDGTLKGVFDILDTPNGRILKTLCDYGVKIGVSSRGSGDVVEDYNGKETVDPDTYEMECWDAVLLPAVKSARPAYITESINSTKSLKKALTEALEKSNPDERRVMTETLEELNIDIKPEKEEDIEKVEDVTTKDDIAADNDGADVMVEQLQEALKNQETLELKVKQLQEQLSVCNAKEAKYEEEINRYKSTIISLSDSARKSKEYKKQIDSLNEELTHKRSSNDDKDEELKKAEEKLQQSSDKIQSLRENLAKRSNTIQTLTEQLDKKNETLEQQSKEIQRLTEQVNSQQSRIEAQSTRLKSQIQKSKEERTALNETIEELHDEISRLENTNKSLNESITNLKQNSAIKSKQSKDELEKKVQLIEHYKKIAQTSISKYVEVRAKMIGVSPNEILNRLNENYSFKDIDNICEDLRSYKLNVSKLPFQIDSQKPTKMKIVESKNESLKMPSDLDDTIDDDLICLMEGINH